jgi:Rrf2 family protein
VVYIAQHAVDGPVPAKELAEAVDVPQNYMGKILHELARAGILKSARGKRGGFVLGVPASKLTLLKVASRFDNLGRGRRCLLGRPECRDRNPCPAHHRWREIADQIATFFRETTVADLVDSR